MESQKQVRVDEALVRQLSFGYPAALINNPALEINQLPTVCERGQNHFNLEALERGVLLY